MNILTQARLALVARLQTITVANGYRTNAGTNVRTGWFSEVLEAAGVGFPLICVQKAAGLQPVAGPGAIRAAPGFSVVGAVDAGLDDYDSAIEDLQLDLLQCLLPEHGKFLRWAPPGVVSTELGAPEEFPPGNGTQVASVLVPVHLHTIINGD
mgnify:CR=1 FL=1